MLIQWCIKGVSLPDDATAQQIIADRKGLLCQWWLAVGNLPPEEIPGKLTPDNIDMHINQFDQTDPATGVPFKQFTPFISLSAGTMERDTILATNIAHHARRTALYFGSNFNEDATAYLYLCWLVVSPRRSVAIEGVAEEVRDLNVYRRYSAFQTEGEITAKLRVPASQIQHCEKWQKDDDGVFMCTDTWPNPEFISPQTLSNIRELI